MALIHETLYRTGKFSNVDMSIYLKNLVDQIAQSYGIRSDINVFVDVDGTQVSTGNDGGLIINELVTNSFSTHSRRSLTVWRYVEFHVRFGLVCQGRWHGCVESFR